nr:coiled-coil domain-containing protein 158-like isoform X1 [Rhipicephalus microplus]
MAALEQATSEEGNLQPAGSAYSDVPCDESVLGGSAAMPSSSKDTDSGDEEKKNDEPQAMKELDSVTLAAHTTEQVSHRAELCDEAELEVLLCLLEQRLSAPAVPSTDEQNQQLWEKLRSLVPEYKGHMKLMRQQITDLEELLEDNQRESLHWREHHMEEHRKRLAAVAEDYERLHVLALERASNARQQAESLLIQLAQAQAENKRLESEMHSTTKRLEGDHLRELEVLAEKHEAQLRAKSSEYQEEAAALKNLQQQYLADKTKHQAEVSSLHHEKAELEARLKGQEAINEDLMSVLEKERNLNQHLTVAMGEHEKKIAQLEHQVCKLQSEVRHKEMLNEVLSSKVSLDIAAGTDNVRGHAPLPQTDSQNPTAAASGSKADSGVQGMSSGSRSHEEVSVCSNASQVSPQEGLKLDQELKDITSKLDKKKAAVLQAKCLLRSTTNELQKLTKLAEERAKMLQRLQSRMQSTSMSLSTPGGQKQRAGDDNAHHVRTTSSGFVPLAAAPSFLKTVRKVCNRKTATAQKESLGTLASVSSIQNNFESSGISDHVELPLDEMSDSDVFESTHLHEKHSAMPKAAYRLPRHLCSTFEMESIETPHKLAGGCFQYSEEKSYMSDAVFKSHVIDDQDPGSARKFSFGFKQATSLLDQSSKAVTPLKTSTEEVDTDKVNTRGASSNLEDKSPMQKAISRSPWERDQSCRRSRSGHGVQSTPSYDFPLLGKSKVWNYVDHNNHASEPACHNGKSCTSSVQRKGARRSLTFPEEGLCPTVPTVHCSAGASDISANVPQERSFRGGPYPVPVNVTVQVQAYPESKGSHR